MALAKTEKEVIVDAIKSLPDDAGFDDAMERLYHLSKLERGLKQAENGQTVTHDDVVKSLDKWLK